MANAQATLLGPRPQPKSVEEPGSAEDAQAQRATGSKAKDLAALLATSRRFWGLRPAVTQQLRCESCPALGVSASCCWQHDSSGPNCVAPGLQCPRAAVALGLPDVGLVMPS